MLSIAYFFNHVEHTNFQNVQLATANGISYVCLLSSFNKI